MRKLPPKPALSRKKFTVSYPGEIEPEVSQRLAKLGMTPQQHYESLLAFDLLLEKSHIITGPHVKAGRLDAWHLWQEVVEEFGNPKKEIVAYIEMFLERVMRRGMELKEREGES